MHRFIALAIALASAPLLSVAVTAAGPKTDIVRIYSDFCFHDESGDILGHRIIILRLPEGDFAQYESEAEIYRRMEHTPTTTQTVAAKIAPNGRDITFTLTETGWPGTFKGAMTDEALVGVFSFHENETLKLRRVKRWRKGFASCG